MTKEVCQTVYDERSEQQCKTEWRTVVDEDCSTVMDEQCSTDMEYVCNPVEVEEEVGNDLCFSYSCNIQGDHSARIPNY